ncbi:MAG: multiheme c-type cytochrome [Pirellulales bacterium]
MRKAINTIGRTAVQYALAAAVIVVACRMVQLGRASTDPAPSSPCKADEPSTYDAELARLYAACPMAGVIDLEQAAASPDQVDALLPPYRLTADRVPDPPVEPAVPRIRYPIRLAAKPPQAASRIASNDDWLIDPQEWYTSEEQEPPESVSGPEFDEPSNSPSESQAPPTNPVEPPPPPAPRTETFAAPPGRDSEESLPTPVAAPATEAAPPESPTQQPTQHGVDPHLELFTKNAYPSARECAQCHEDIYHEWSASAHAYAAVSPMFHKFEQKLNDLSQGTVGYFCLRCHSPVANALCASRDEPLWNLPEVAREGVTCIACHRVQYVYGKSNGERRIEPGNVFAPVFGGIGGDGVAETIHRKDHFKVKTSPDEPGPGQNIHVQGIYFDPLTRSEFCTPCHQVAVHPGIKLEVVWEQYRASPACKKGIQCQDCHMGRVPGLPLGYNVGPVAKMADKTVNDCRKRSNHIFYGPNYSIAHPGVFPFHLQANRWRMDEWLAFDWRAGWGTEAFEDRVADGEIHVEFPPVWAEVDDRYDAREIIEENLKKLHQKRDLRIEVMENGSHVAGPFFETSICRGQELRFHYVITNTNEGHNLLTASLGAQPQFWANVVLIGPDGRRLWETGYTDSYGDLANIHSVDVRHKRIPYDAQLFNLQTMFLITGAKGTDREFFVPVNVDIDQLPFIRPGVQPISVINHPPFIRMESQSLAPLGSRRAPYCIPGHLIQQPGTYRLAFRMRSRSEPMYLMRFCGATTEMQRSMNEWMVDVHPLTVEFTVR